jgi:ketosteroid isomerase-like protein
MGTLAKQVKEFVELVTTGQTVESMERFYSEDVNVFENRELARSGRAICVAEEARLRAAQPSPPRVRALKIAVNEADGVAFIEWIFRFTSPEGRPLRLEEVAVQKWEHGRIIEERFYYQGLVDEGDDEDDINGRATEID